MNKITFIESKTIVDGIIENGVQEYAVPMEKGLDSSINSMCHMIHKLATLYSNSRTKGMDVSYTVRVDDKDTHIVISSKVGLVIKEEKGAGYLKEAGLKKIALKDFTQEHNIFRITLPVIASVVKYHLGSYLETSTREESYKTTAKTFFDRDMEKGKSDLVSWSVQTRSAAEKTIYAIQDLTESAKAENTDSYLDSKRKTSSLAIAFKAEQRKQIAAAKK